MRTNGNDAACVSVAPPAAHGAHTGSGVRSPPDLPCVLEPRVVGGPFRVECQRTAAEVARVAVVRGNLCSGGACKKLIAIKRDKRFGVSRHNIGPLAYDAQA